MIELAKDLFKYLVIAAITFFLMFRVIKPAFHTLLTPVGSTGDGAANEQGAATPGINFTSSNPGYEQSLQTARQIAQQEPKIVASVIKEWVNSNG